jgi:hypothetical protein
MLSKKNKQSLIDYITQNLTVDTIESRDNIDNPLYIFKSKFYPEKFIMSMRDWVKSNYDFEDSELEKTLKLDDYDNSKLFKLFDKRHKYIEGYVTSIINVLKLTDVDNFEFRYNQTNYTDCHNILVSLPFDYYNIYLEDQETRYFEIQIRKDDFPFNEGDCYGRNTRTLNSFDLTDENIDKYCKKIGIKLA